MTGLDIFAGKKIRGAIFDIDGTLLDTMAFWEDVGARYLKSIHVEAEPGLGELLFTMTLEEGYAYMKEHYKLSQSKEEISTGILNVIDHFYREEAEFKPGMKELLYDLHEKGISMTLATTSDKELVTAALTRHGVMDLFDRLYTATELQTNKKEPLIYETAASYMGTAPAETAVFEDVFHALKTAKAAGFYTIAVYDEASQKDWSSIEKLADKVIHETCLHKKGLNRMKTALTIAGSDSSGGAGIQADIKTMTMNGVFAMSAITALTAQNTTGVTGISEVSPEFLGQQLDAVFTDIRPDAVKIGMVSSSGLIEMIASKLQEYKAENIVVDPVMVATSGAKLISDDAIGTLKEKLLPLASVLTPNIPEAEVLSGMTIRDENEMITAAKVISETYSCACLLKGGHQINDANDLLYRDGGYVWFKGKRIDNPNTHGTGCTLSSAIASNLAKGFDLDNSVKRAKEYISGALAAMLDLGQGSGPMQHNFDLGGEYAKEAE